MEALMKSNLEALYFLSKSLTIFSELKNDTVIKNLCKIIELLFLKDFDKIVSSIALECYSKMCTELYKNKSSLPDYIYNLIRYSENIFSSLCAGNEEIPLEILLSAKNDIKTLIMFANIKAEKIIDCMIEKNNKILLLRNNLPQYSSISALTAKFNSHEDFIKDLIKFYSSNGIGIFAKYYSFRVERSGEIIPVLYPDRVKLSDLKLYEAQKQKAQDNLVAFMRGNSYNNALLYGDRGTGKSSCVKALANEYALKGLRIIQFDKTNLCYLASIMQKLSANPLKFLIFIDDLTFNEDDDSMGLLKAVLEGSICLQPKNIVIYATSNRRHIVKETFSAREGDEIHQEDTIDELISLSDRFGLMITYQKPSKDNFLEIVHQIAHDKGINIALKELEQGAERFALLKGYRSPRVAHQFLDLMYGL